MKKLLLVSSLILLLAIPCFAQTVEKYRISAAILGSLPITTLDADYKWSAGFGIFVDRQLGEHSMVGFSYVATKVLGKGEWTDLDLQNYSLRTKFHLKPITDSPWNLYLVSAPGVSLIDPGNTSSKTGLGLSFGVGYVRSFKTFGVDIGLDVVTFGVFQDKPVNTLVPHLSAYFPFSL